MQTTKLGSSLTPHTEDVDCLILGGGITGAGIARDAAIRGLKTILVDSRDFASGTSHLTSKLIHGGLRYLPQGKFKLVIEGVTERDRLLNQIAPHLVRPLRFIVPYSWSKFVNWLTTAAGIHGYGFLEWWRSGRGCPPLFGPQLRRQFPYLRAHPFAVSYWDAQASDARLVISVLRSAECLDATILNYTTLDAARFADNRWHCQLSQENANHSIDVHARVVINATGPWSPDTAQKLGVPASELMWIKGSHLLLRRFPEFGPDAIVIRSVRDRRLLWVIPWETRLIVGTTESRYDGDLRNVRATSDEVDDLFQSFRRYFPSLNASTEDIVGTYAGVRPIVPQEGDKENRLSRRHEILVDGDRRLVTVNGGKLTTFRRMAEETIDAVESILRMETPSNHELTPPKVRQRLRNEIVWPGQDRPQIENLSRRLNEQFANRLQTSSINHLVRLYGSDAEAIVETMIGAEGSSKNSIDLQLPYTSEELAYLCREEHVVHLLDLLKRRTPLYFLGKLDCKTIRRIAEIAATTLNWDSARVDRECELVEAEMEADRRSIEFSTRAAAEPVAAPVLV